MLVRSAAAIAFLAVGITSAAAQQDAIKARKDMMENAARQFFVMYRTQRGQTPYDQAKIDASIATLSDFGQKYGTMFPEDSKPKDKKSDYDASPKVWANKSDFDSKLAALSTAVSGAQGKVKDVDSLKVAVTAIDNACNGCHETYRVKNH
jgi:cytochrome c556